MAFEAAVVRACSGGPAFGGDECSAIAAIGDGASSVPSFCEGVGDFGCPVGPDEAFGEGVVVQGEFEDGFGFVLVEEVGDGRVGFVDGDEDMQWDALVVRVGW